MEMLEDHLWKLENIELTRYDMLNAPQKTIGEYTFLIRVKGKGIIEFNHESYGADKSELVLFGNPGSIIRYVQTTPHDSLLMYQLTIGIYARNHQAENVMYEKQTEVLLPNGEWGSSYYFRLRDLAEMMELLWREREPADSFRIQMYLNECLHLLAKEVEEAKFKDSDNMITQATTYIQEHYADEINRSQLADMAGINQDYFSRLFKKKMGLTFSEYLTETRIKKAQEYLLTSKSSLREIAQRVGYRNEFYLSQKFKQVTGIAPSHYIKQPKRVASVSSNYTSCLLALGIIPVIAKINPFVEALFEQQLESHGMQKIDLLTLQCNPLIAAAKPDLVICYDTYEHLEELKKIAPTVSIALFKQNWREQLREISTFVNEEMKAAAWLHHYDEKAAIARDALKEKISSDATIGIYEIWKDKIMVFGDSYGRGGHVMYQDLNLSPPERIRSEVFQGQGYKIIPLEALPEYAADYMFVTIFQAKGGEAYASEVMSSPVWKQLPAVCNGQVYVNDHGVFYNWDPISTEMQLEKIVQLLMS